MYMIYNIIYILHKFNIYLGATERIPYIALNKYATNSTMDNSKHVKSYMLYNTIYAITKI